MHLPMITPHPDRLRSLAGQAVEQAQRSIDKGLGGPFGAVVATKSGRIVAADCDRIPSSHDPTNHAEITAIRKAFRVLHTPSLKGHILVTSCEPRPQCLATAYEAEVGAIYYADTRHDPAARAGFDDAKFYQDINAFIEQRFSDIGVKTSKVSGPELTAMFQEWNRLTGLRPPSNETNGKLELAPAVSAMVATPEGAILAAASNEAGWLNDPTAHGGVRAIQKACGQLRSFRLTGLRLAMACGCLGCLGGALWSRPAELIVGDGDETVKQNASELLKLMPLLENPENHAKMPIPMIKVDFPKALEPFYRWQKTAGKVQYY